MSRFGRAPRGAVIASAIVCAYGLGAVSGPGPDRREAAAAGSMLDEAAAEIGRGAARPVGRADLDRHAIEGMLRGLGDEWARYHPARRHGGVEGRRTGHYSGVGLWLGAEDGDERVRVASVRPGTAAARAGVRAGDAVARIDGASTTGWDLDRVAEALRGPAGDPVDLAVTRDSRTRTFHLVRTPVTGGDVTVTDEAGGVRTIRVGAFTSGTGERVRAAAAPAPSGGFVLDLRGNPGGLLEEAVEAASAFLADGPVVTYERRGEPPRRYTVTRPGDARTPLVVLVDAGTASAAEIVTGSLRDRDRAVLVGSRTYGKGSVQETVELSDGSTIELTVGRYRTPSGRNLDGVGIEPDVAVSADRPPEAAEQRARTVLRGLDATLPDKDRG